MSADVFLSYKSEEEAYARRVRDVLEANGISCWMAPDSIPSGSNYMKQIPQAIDQCKVMIVLVSQKSQESTWVRNEFSQAVSKDKLVIPYVIQDCKLIDEFEFSMSTMQQVYAWKNEEAALERIVKDIRDVLGQNPDAKIEITVKTAKKTNPLVYAALAAAVVLAIAAGVILLRKKPAVPAGGGELYYSEVLPYSLSGFYETAKSAEDDAFTLPAYEKAFSILSFIRSNAEKPVMVEKIAVDLLEVTPVTEPDLSADSVFDGETLTSFVYNGGWGDAEKVEVEWYLKGEEGIPVDAALIESLTGSAEISLPAGQPAKVFEAVPDFGPLLAWARTDGNLKYSSTLATFVVQARCNDQEASSYLFLFYDRESGQLTGTYGGADVSQIGVTLYGVLNVDNPPSSLNFAVRDEVPFVEDSYRIETVVIPTKSCDVTCRGSYSIGGEPYETETYRVRVDVPQYQEYSLSPGGALTWELSKVNMNDAATVNRILSKYRYDIESILPEDAPRG